jgi:anti-sigma regulatory factor (Ser/Thr protein kinase)
MSARVPTASGAQPAAPSPDGNGAGPTRTRHRRYPGTSDQMPLVRAFLATLLDGCPAADDAVLLTDELAANAVLHSRSREPGGTFGVTAHVCPGQRVRVEVADGGGPETPHLRDSDAAGGLDIANLDPGSGLGGRGLRIVHALADGWGVSGDAAGRTVWFELAWGQRQQPG